MQTLEHAGHAASQTLTTCAACQQEDAVRRINYAAGHIPSVLLGGIMPDGGDLSRLALMLENIAETSKYYLGKLMDTEDELRALKSDVAAMRRILKD